MADCSVWEIDHPAILLGVMEVAMSLYVQTLSIYSDRIQCHSNVKNC